jgi:hypothetical protein
MRYARLALVVLAILLIAVPAAQAAGLTVSNDRTAIETKLGHKFVFHSTIRNSGTIAATGLVAHLNVVDLSGHTYVDPEDWSSHRTRYLAPIPAGGSTTISWPMNAVNSGTIGVYVAVLPRSGAPVPPTTGPTLRVRIQDRKTLNSGGILPLALGLPALLGLLALGVRLRRAR